MTDHAPDYVYVTYIKTTPKQVWDAITVPEFTRQYWRHANVSDWKKGSDWEHKTEDGKALIHGKVIESLPPKHLSMTWSQPGNEKNASTASFDIEVVGDMVRLTVTHSELIAGSDMARGIAIGWPRVLSSLKSLLETGVALDTFAGHVSCEAQATSAAA
jgi:uncharacterized protein YndB with AHSA1/START domain